MRTPLSLMFVFVLYCPVAWPQGEPVGGSHEMQVWTSGGYGINGSASDTGLWNVGLRFGWVLTPAAGPGFLRGRFEYAVDAVPVFLLTQRTGPTYGFGLNAFAFKWVFVPRRHLSPYAEIGGGTLFTADKAPPGTSRVNFTTGGAFGLHVLRGKYNWSVEARFMHISNAGMTSPNPGINTMQVRIGLGRFTQPK